MDAPRLDRQVEVPDPEPALRDFDDSLAGPLHDGQPPTRDRVIPGGGLRRLRPSDARDPAIDDLRRRLGLGRMMPSPADEIVEEHPLDDLRIGDAAEVPAGL